MPFREPLTRTGLNEKVYLLQQSKPRKLGQRIGMCYFGGPAFLLGEEPISKNYVVNDLFVATSMSWYTNDDNPPIVRFFY